jgi:hypothetical protein
MTGRVSVSIRLSFVRISDSSRIVCRETLQRFFAAALPGTHFILISRNSINTGKKRE